MTKQRALTLVTALACWVTVLAAAGCGSSAPAVLAGTQGCSGAAATGPALHPPQRVQVLGDLASAPYAVAATAQWAFVSSPGPPGKITVLAMHGATARLVRTVDVPGEPFGVTLAGRGRYLLAANYQAGLEVFSTAALEAGHAASQAPLAQLPAPGWTQGGYGPGSDEVAVSADGRYAFVPLEQAGVVDVYALGGLAAGGSAAGAHLVGAVHVGTGPSGLDLSPSGSALYVISQGASQTSQGTLSEISVATAERDPARALTGSIDAGCNPVRVTLSGGLAWVSDRGGNTLSAFRLSPAGDHVIGHLAAHVRVGRQPVGVTPADAGALILVTDSGRSSSLPVNQTIAVVGTARALAGRPALLGYLPAGAFPRQFGQAAGGPLLVTDFASNAVQVISQPDLAWLGRL